MGPLLVTVTAGYVLKSTRRDNSIDTITQVPVVSMASLELEPGEHVIELCFSMGDGSPDGRTTVFYNGGIMVTTVYPILVTSYDTLDSK